MMFLRRHILPWVMSLLIALTGQAAAVAHAAPGPAGQIELCTGAGPVMVYLDENGEPMGDPVFCPDFALSLILALDLPAALPVPKDLNEARLQAVDLAVAFCGQCHVTLRARGPPILI